MSEVAAPGAAADALVGVDEHLADLLAGHEPLEPLALGLAHALGCVLAEDVAATAPAPRFDTSAMDGYAVRAGDTDAASAQQPVALDVVGDAPAGRPAGVTVAPGSCTRVATGGLLPEGADAVVPVEDTDAATSGAVRVRVAAQPGAYVRRAGEDVAVGQVLARAGEVLGPGHVGLLAADGRRDALVRPHPRVVVLSTGDELVEPGRQPGPGQVHDANSWALAAAVRLAGGTPYRVGVVRDDPAELRRALEDQLVRADLVLTSGGVSVGERDVVKAALGGSADVTFRRVAVQPGMPQGFGTLGPDRVPFVGLPGNPVSALVSFEVFVRPLIRLLAGRTTLHRPVIAAHAVEAFPPSPADKRQYARARLGVRDGVYAVWPVGGSGSHLLTGMAAADALAVVPEATTQVRPGDVLQVLDLRADRDVAA